MKPKIFIWATQLVDGPFRGDWVGHATAEDGAMLAQHLSSALIYVKLDMGLIRKNHHTDDYDKYYPDGYELVDLTELNEDELENHPDLNAALDLGIQRMEEEDE